MKIRPMVHSDRETVLQLIRATGMFNDDEERVAAELIDIYLDEPGQKDYVVEVVANAADQAEGYVCHGPTPLTEGTTDLYWIAVHPACSRQGLGKALMAHVEKSIRHNNGRLIIIETSGTARYESTRLFYLGLGYKETGRIKNYYRPGDDRVIYCKYL